MEELVGVTESRVRELQAIKRAERERMIDDARSRGLDTSGPVAWAFKHALGRLISVIGF